MFCNENHGNHRNMQDLETIDDWVGNNSIEVDFLGKTRHNDFAKLSGGKRFEKTIAI